MANTNENNIPLPSEAELTNALRSSLAKKYGANSPVTWDSDSSFQDAYVSQDYHNGKTYEQKQQLLVEALRKSENIDPNKNAGWSADIAASYHKLNPNNDINASAVPGQFIANAYASAAGANDWINTHIPEPLHAVVQHYSEQPKPGTPTTDDIMAMTKYNRATSKDPMIKDVMAYQEGWGEGQNGESKVWASAADRQKAAIIAFKTSIGEHEPNDTWGVKEQAAYERSKSESLVAFKKDPNFASDIAGYYASGREAAQVALNEAAGHNIAAGSQPSEAHRGAVAQVTKPSAKHPDSNHPTITKTQDRKPAVPNSRHDDGREVAHAPAAAASPPDSHPALHAAAAAAAVAVAKNIVTSAKTDPDPLRTSLENEKRADKTRDPAEASRDANLLARLPTGKITLARELQAMNDQKNDPEGLRAALQQEINRDRSIHSTEAQGEVKLDEYLLAQKGTLTADTERVAMAKYHQSPVDAAAAIKPVNTTPPKDSGFGIGTVVTR